MDQRPEEPATDSTPAAPAPPAERRAKVKKPSVEGNVKETIESILVAFILAFIFRAFVVEAFVIPTGSMAPTLLGAHMRYRCGDCGYRFDVNFQGTETGGDDVYIPASAGANRYFAIFCPNCGYRMPRTSSDDPANDAHDSVVRYGDRILVLKYLYLFREPKRWDVVVFKSPHDPGHFDYAQNYIKRLVGKPGESVMILDGDIYVGAGDELNTYKVRTKPRQVQEALWRIVYNNDYHPRKLERSYTLGSGGTISDDAWEQPWKQQSGQSGWTIGDGSPGNREFAFDNPSGAATLAFDPQANPLKHGFTDWLAYDATDNQQTSGGATDTFRSDGYITETNNYNVSDIKLEFFYHRRDGDGPLRAQLTKLDHVFEAQLLPDTVTLTMDGKPIAGPAPLPAGSSQPLHVEIANVDYRVSVRIDGKEMLATTEEQYHPDLTMLMDAYRAKRKLPKPAVRLAGENQSCVLTHVSVWRDVYYLNRGRGGDPLNWASPHDFPARVMHLGEDEFFVLGDNSYVSLDARYWDEPIRLPHEGLDVAAGRVPRRFMLGKAFFVYWPAGYRPISSAPALAPNFGDMRFIH